MAAASPVVRLAVWSGPRNISTALMRSWENRDDTMVIDEPLYAHYLNATGLDHPGRAEVIAAGETDWRKVVSTLLGPVSDGITIFYQKHMAHHLVPGIARSWIVGLTNVMLIRDPREVLASYVRSRADVTPDDLGLPQQTKLYDELVTAAMPPPVIDARDFLLRPEAYLPRAVPPRRGGLRRLDAGVAARSSGVRRCVGSVLVRRRVEVDPVRRVSATQPAT